MAVQMETPSRIWRRIKDDEARDAEMPSLPSLPALDESNISALDYSSSLADNMLDVIPRLSVDGHPRAESPRALTRANVRRVEEVDLSVLSDQSDSDASAMQRRKEDGVDKPGSLAHASSSAGRSLSMALREPNGTDVDTNIVSTDKSQAPYVSDNNGSLSNAVNTRDFKDVAIRRPYGSNRPAISAPSLSPSSVNSFSRLDFRAPTGDFDKIYGDQENHISNAETSPASPKAKAEKRLLQSNAEEPSEAEEDSGPRDPTSASEGEKISRVTGTSFVQTVSLRAGISTPSQIYQSHFIEKPGGKSAENLQEQTEADDLATPLPRRKSFLLSVVNSTTRPRLTIPTPHPQAHLQKTIGIVTGCTPGPSHFFNTSGRRARLSQPFSQISAFVPSTPINTFPIGAEVDDAPDGAGTASFVSTASSHDLTVHHRANASFDPLTGPQGVGRFNAGKLNTYLHGLNRRLQEENEVLVNRIRSQQEELQMFHDQAQHRELSGVVEDEAAEQWVLDKEILEQKVAVLEQRLEAKDQELADEHSQRMHDKERWKERMTEVEDGVGHIVTELEKRVEEEKMKRSEVELQLQRVQEQLDSARVECQLLRQHAEQAEQATADDSALHATDDADDAPYKLQQRVQSLTYQLQEKDKLLADKDSDVSSLKSIIRDLESSVRVIRETTQTSQEDAKELRSEQRELKDQLQTARTMVDKLQKESDLARDRTKLLEKQLAEEQEMRGENNEALDIANERLAITSDELEKARLNIQQLESSLEDSDRKILLESKGRLELQSKLSSMEREIDKARLFDHSQIDLPVNEVGVNAREAELADALKEIGRLTALLEQNPARRALDKARESRINLLEKENQELLDQLRLIRDPSYYVTPQRQRNASMSGLSPMHRRLINLTMKTPRTPGEPLRNASWLMSMTGEISTSHLMEEIGRLQRELDLANESIDDKLDKLEEAGLGVVGLTKALENARRQIMDLESQLEEQGAELPRYYPCARCGNSEMGKPTSRDPNTTLQLRLTMAMSELESLRRQRDEEVASSSGERAVLRDATNRLTVQIRQAKEELKVAQDRGYKAEKTKTELQQELTSARKTIDDLEFYLQSERVRLRAMSMENSTAVKEKERILERLNETEQRMDQTKDRLALLKEANIKLEAELRVERKTASIEEALIGNKETIERLRQERSQLSDKYHDLQQCLGKASTNASDLATRHAKLQISYDGRRRQLDRQSEEIETLRAALSSQAQALDVNQANKNIVHSDGLDLGNLASKLEYELRRIQQEAKKFGCDLVHLRAERDQMVVQHREELEQYERSSKQLRAQLRTLQQQLTSRNLASEIYAATESLRFRHNRECKGLVVQIGFLKAKFTREAALRDDLAYQKSYLLVLLSRFENSEKRILATIAQIKPVTPLTQSARFKSLRAAVFAIMFISRTRRESDAWRKEREACSGLAAALNEVRKNRALKE